MCCPAVSSSQSETQNESKKHDENMEQDDITMTSKKQNGENNNNDSLKNTGERYVMHVNKNKDHEQSVNSKKNNNFLKNLKRRLTFDDDDCPNMNDWKDDEPEKKRLKSSKNKSNSSDSWKNLIKFSEVQR